MRRHAGRSAAPDLVHDTVRAPGRPLDQPVRAHFESRFHQDFSRVRVHAGSDAAQSAASIHARAYTAGDDVVFGAHQYDPATRDGHRLLAHELTHVAEQREPHRTPLHAETASVMRADRDAVRQVNKLTAVVGAGIHFFPDNVVDTQIGLVGAKPGLQAAGVQRLSVIIAEGLSPRVLARQILPLWTTATPFTPPGGGPPVEAGPLTEEQLAQGLLSYNEYYLGLPDMSKWRAGFRFPLPVDVDDAGIATLNPGQIRAMATGFDPANNDLLDHRAIATDALPAPIVFEEARLFLAEKTTSLARGMAIGARAVTNAKLSAPMILEVLKQLSAADGLTVALEAVESLMEPELTLLSVQTDGGRILDALDVALRATPAPAALQVRTKTALDRLDKHAVHILNDPPSKVPSRAEKTVEVDTLKVAGSNLNPSTQVQVASAIYAQCNVRIAHGVNRDAPATFLGDDNVFHATLICGTPTKEQRALYDAARKDYGFKARIQAFFVPTMKGVNASAFSYPGNCSPGKYLNTTVLSDSSDNSTLAHEIGHLLLNPGSHADKNTIMEPRPRPNEITDKQCKRIYDNA